MAGQEDRGLDIPKRPIILYLQAIPCKAAVMVGDGDKMLHWPLNSVVCTPRLTASIMPALRSEACMKLARKDRTNIEQWKSDVNFNIKGGQKLKLVFSV